MQIDPKLRGKMPRVDAPASFVPKEGSIRGWKVVLPGHRPLATPAVVDGRVFLGGGFGSYDFYALDALTGQIAWQHQTTDDGPTATVVSDGHVVFSTESCELEVLTLEGRAVWKHWLGDPLMSMPAVGAGRVYAAYPDSNGDHRHYLAAFDLLTGRQHWKQPINGEIITAPVLAEEHVYMATLDGTLCCFRQQDGTAVWKEDKQATSAPAVWKGQCYFGQRHEMPPQKAGDDSPQQAEYLAGRGRGANAGTTPFPCTGTPADYLDHGKRLRGSPQYRAYEMADAAVGFASHKGDAKMAQAMLNLGKGHISDVWSHQGSKPFVWRERLYSALGDAVHCVDPETRTPHWKRTLRERTAGEEVLDGLLTPPAIANGKLFLGGLDGEVRCLSAWSGDQIWSVHVGEPILFQPAVAKGRVYVTTQLGSLVCLETGDEQDDGWLMWGAGPEHNGVLN
jgi:outer membrane protein assembly factor BamB